MRYQKNHIILNVCNVLRFWIYVVNELDFTYIIYCKSSGVQRGCFILCDHIMCEKYWFLANRIAKTAGNWQYVWKASLTIWIMQSDYGEGDQAHIKSELWKCIWLTYYKTTGATRIRRDASKGMALMKSTIHFNQLINILTYKYVINILIKATVSNLKLQKKVPSKVSTSAHSHTLISLKGWFHGGSSVATG